MTTVCLMSLPNVQACLHRSDTNMRTQQPPMDRFWRESQRKGRGFNADKACPFKPLGNPPPVSDIRQLREIHDEQLLKIELQCSREKNSRRARTNAGRKLHHAEPKSAAWEAREGSELEGAADVDPHVVAPAHTDAHSRRTRDTPRRDNGFASLAEFVKESNARLGLVKSGEHPGLLYGLDMRFTMEDYLMPNRKNYPNVSGIADEDQWHIAREKSFSARGDVDREAPTGARNDRQPMTAREVVPAAPAPRQGVPRNIASLDERARRRKFLRCPNRPSVPQEYKNRACFASTAISLPTQMPIQLPSLDAHSGATGSTAIAGVARDALEDDASKGGANASAVRAGEKDWNRNFRRKLERAEKENLRELKECGGELAVVDGKQLSLQIHDEKKNEDLGREREDMQDGVEPHDKSEKHVDPYEKVLALMREHDPRVSPVRRLQDALDSFSHIREHHTGRLLQSLYSMDADRLNCLMLKAKHFSPEYCGPLSDPTVMCQYMRLNAERELLEKFVSPEGKRQLFWYRDLLRDVRKSDSTLSESRRNRYQPVMHFMFDYIRRVLEYGKVFEKKMLFNMLEVIDNDEFTAPVADLVWRIIQGVDEVQVLDVVCWFKEHRECVPAGFEAIGAQDEGATFVTQT